MPRHAPWTSLTHCLSTPLNSHGLSLPLSLALSEAYHAQSYPAQRCAALRRTELRCPVLSCTVLYCAALRYPSLRCAALRGMTLPSITGRTLQETTVQYAEKICGRTTVLRYFITSCRKEQVVFLPLAER